MLDDTKACVYDCDKRLFLKNDENRCIWLESEASARDGQRFEVKRQQKIIRPRCFRSRICTVCVSLDDRTYGPMSNSSTSAGFSPALSTSILPGPFAPRTNAPSPSPNSTSPTLILAPPCLGCVRSLITTCK